MPLAKCPRCEKLFDKALTAVCLNCAVAEESDYERVKDCLREFPDLKPDAIVEKTGVDLRCVMRMVDQGLVTSSSSMGETKCGRCGAPAISASKRLCPDCLEDLNSQVTAQRQHLLSAPRQAKPGAEPISVRRVLESRRGKAR